MTVQGFVATGVWILQDPSSNGTIEHCSKKNLYLNGRPENLHWGLQVNCPEQQIIFLPHGLPRGVPVMEVVFQSLIMNLLREGQKPKLCMWVLPSLWMFGLAAKTPSKCTTPLVTLNLSLQGHHHGVDRLRTVLSPITEPLTLLRLRTLRVALL